MKTVYISIDDISPHPKSGLSCLNNLKPLITQFPEVKISLFVPVAYQRTHKFPTDPLYIFNYPDFIRELKKCLDTPYFEAGYHGYKHGIPGISDNDEFKDIDYTTANYIFSSMRRGVYRADLQFAPIFRPPAWWMSPESMKSACDNGIQVLCLNESPRYIEFYKDGPQKSCLKVNWANCFPPFAPLSSDYHNISIVYHACEWDQNYLSVEKVTELIKFLHGIPEKRFKFCSDG